MVSIFLILGQVENSADLHRPAGKANTPHRVEKFLTIEITGVYCDTVRLVGRQFLFRIYRLLRAFADAETAIDAFAGVDAKLCNPALAGVV